VDARISAVRGGAHTNAFYLSQTKAADTYTASQTGQYTVPLGNIWFDYANGSNGTGYTIKETGLYQINAALSFNSVAIRGSRHMFLKQTRGTSAPSTFLQDSYVVGVKDARWSNGRVNGSILWPLQKGDKVSLYCQLENDSADTGKFTVTWGRLNGFKVKDL
jgi:hypothetical protein